MEGEENNLQQSKKILFEIFEYTHKKLKVKMDRVLRDTNKVHNYFVPSHYFENREAIINLPLACVPKFSIVS